MALPDRPMRNHTSNNIPTPPSLPRKPGGIPSFPAPPKPTQWDNNGFDLAGGSDGGNSYEEETYEEETYPQESYEQEEYSQEPEPEQQYYAEQSEENTDEDFDNVIEDEFSALSEDAQESLEYLIQEILSDDSSEVIMNGPNSIHCKRSGRRVRLSQIDFGDEKTYHQVINQFILNFTDTKDRIYQTKNLIEGQLELSSAEDPDIPPMVARVHVMAPPAVKFAKVTIAKKARKQFTLDDIYHTGAMNANMYEFMRAIINGKLTTIFSGMSGSGKTTLLEASSHYFDPDDRVIVVEDTPELKFDVPDVAYLLSHKPRPDEPASSAISLEWLVAQANRMRPDRIIIGETRGAEMAEFLVAANSGADGSMTTLHAQDPERAWNKMAVLASKAGDNRSEASIVRDIASTVQIIIQMALIDGEHVITDICEVSDIVNMQTNKIALTPLFTYDRRSKTHRAVSRPSDSLKSFLQARGVTVDQSWFQR